MPLNNFGIINIDGAGTTIARCAQPDNEGLEILNKLKFDYIFKLNSYDESQGVDYSIFKGTVIYEPYPSIYNIPTIDKILDDVRRIRNAFANNQSIVIQCTYGKDRTGLESGTYRILYDNWTFDQVEAERQLYGATGLIDNIADSKIIEFLKNLKP